MGGPDGAHTHHGHGGPDLGLVVVILAALALAGPVVAAVTAIVHLLVIVVTGAVVLAVAGGGALLAYRLRHPRKPPAVPWAPRAGLIARQAPGPPGSGVHLHLHGVDPAELPAIIAAARAIPSPRSAWPDAEPVALPREVRPDGR